MKKGILAVLFVFIFFTIIVIGAQEKRPMMPEDLYKIKRLSDPRVSPDGKWLAYTVSVTDLKKDETNSDIWLLALAGEKSRRLTTGPGEDYLPRWAPDGKKIAFISDRDGTENLYLIDIRGGEARKLTDSKTDLYDPTWARNGNYILCGSRVLPPGKKNLENWTKEELPECEARTIDQLLFRQWDRWLGDERNHLFLVDCRDGSMKDVTPADADVPPVSLSSNHDFDISPDEKEICFTRNDDPMPAIGINHDLFLLNIDSQKETRLTDNPALDRKPHYSPDGRFIAYTAMEKVGYEADRECLVIYDRRTKKHTVLTEKLDRSVRQILWAPDSKSIYFTCRDQGRGSIYRVDLKGRFARLSNTGYNRSLDITPDGKSLLFLRSYSHMPDEIFSLQVKGKKGQARQMTFTNATFLAEFELPKLEEFWFTGAKGTKVHGFIQKPPGFAAGKKYPLVLTIHGGPQNMWADRFMITWFNFQLVSSPGYVGVFINPRGSSGYGSAFREQVSKDYGGRCYEDLMKGLDHVIEHCDFVDKERMAAIGGSFGGYSVNWIMGQSDRFRCIVSHAGLYNLTSFYGATEELWFPAWDMGETPWDEPGLYEKWSPHHHARNFKTPCLISHGEKDFRVPFAESLQLFTALKRQGVPARLVVFPDEGHVISEPQNNVRWWKEIHAWLTKFLK